MERLWSPPQKSIKTCKKEKKEREKKKGVGGKKEKEQ